MPGVRTLLVRMHSERAGRFTLRLLLRSPGPPSAPLSLPGTPPGTPAPARSPARAPAGSRGPTPRPSPSPGSVDPHPNPKPEVLYEAAVAVEEAAVSSNDSYAHGFWPPQGAVAGVPAGFAIQARTQQHQQCDVNHTYACIRQLSWLFLRAQQLASMLTVPHASYAGMQHTVQRILKISLCITSLTSSIG